MVLVTKWEPYCLPICDDASFPIGIIVYGLRQEGAGVSNQLQISASLDLSGPNFISFIHWTPDGQYLICVQQILGSRIW
ncbi:MAG: hypothetical protein ACJAUP_003326 [Cellvibrionaceae bacterium]